jgi:hypothetical protein
MLWLTSEAERKRSLWPVVLGSLIVICLAVTLANRFRHTSTIGLVDVRSSAPMVKVQHRDIGVHCWSAPMAVFHFLRASGTEQKVFPKAQTTSFLHVEGSRYNRPPPIS